MNTGTKWLVPNGGGGGGDWIKKGKEIAKEYICIPYGHGQ